MPVLFALSLKGYRQKASLQSEITALPLERPLKKPVVEQLKPLQTKATPRKVPTPHSIGFPDRNAVSSQPRNASPVATYVQRTASPPSIDIAYQVVRPRTPTRRRRSTLQSVDSASIHSCSTGISTPPLSTVDSYSALSSNTDAQNTLLSNTFNDLTFPEDHFFQGNDGADDLLQFDNVPPLGSRRNSIQKDPRVPSYNPSDLQTGSLPVPSDSCRHTHSLNLPYGCRKTPRFPPGLHIELADGHPNVLSAYPRDPTIPQDPDPFQTESPITSTEPSSDLHKFSQLSISEVDPVSETGIDLGISLGPTIATAEPVHDLQDLDGFDTLMDDLVRSILDMGSYFPTESTKTVRETVRVAVEASSNPESCDLPVIHPFNFRLAEDSGKLDYGCRYIFETRSDNPAGWSAIMMREYQDVIDLEHLSLKMPLKSEALAAKATTKTGDFTT